MGRCIRNHVWKRESSRAECDGGSASGERGVDLQGHGDWWRHTWGVGKRRERPGVQRERQTGARRAARPLGRFKRRIRAQGPKRTRSAHSHKSIFVSQSEVFLDVWTHGSGSRRHSRVHRRVTVRSGRGFVWEWGVLSRRGYFFLASRCTGVKQCDLLGDVRYRCLRESRMQSPRRECLTRER